MLPGRKELVLVLLVLMVGSPGYAQRAKDVRISDNDQDVLNINSDGTIPVSISGALTLPSALMLARVTLASDATTFSAATGNIFITSNNTTPTALTGITGATNGQLILIVGGGNAQGTSLADTGVFKLTGAIRLSLDDTILLRASGDASFIEVARSDN